MAPIDDIRTALQTAITDAIQACEPELTRVAQAGGDEASGGLLGDIGRLTDIITGIVGSVVDLIPIVGDIADPFKAVEDAGGKLGTGIGLGYLLGSVGFQALQPIFEPIQHGVANLAQTAIFDPNTAAQLQARGIIDENYGRSEAAGGNMSGEHYDKLVTVSYTYPDIDTTFELLRRQAIQEADAGANLTALGYNSFWLNVLPQLTRVLLSPADLALAQLRGVIDPEFASQYAATLGLVDADFQTLIDNTGEPLGLEQLLEAYRRGFIDEPTLETGIRQSRVRDEWIPTAEALRYSPMSVADAVRATVENYLSDADGQAIAEQNGLLPEHWPLMVESWGRPLSYTEMTRAIWRGLATEDDLAQALRESDLKDKYIPLASQLAETLPPERQVVSMIQHEVITKDQGTALLMAQGYSQQNAEYMIELGASQRTTAHKTLTKADILAMYTDALIPRQTALTDLTGLGYSTDDATSMLDLADYKQRAAALKSTQRAVEATLKNGHITEAQAQTQLVAAGLDSAQAQALIEEWVRQKTVAARTLTEAQIVKALSGGFIQPSDATQRLSALGFSTVDIGIIYELAGLTTEGTAPPPAPAAPTA